MALIRVAQYGSTPGPVTDYQAQNAHLQAFTNQLLTQQFILDSGTDQPVIKQGAYVSHGGSLYVADADTSITGSPADGSVYIRVSGSTSLTVEFINGISGYAWNPVYSALTSGSYTILPYLIVKAGTVWTRYNFNPNNQSFGDTRLNSLAVTGAISGASIDTGQGVTEVHLMNQNLRTTDSPTFAEVVTTNGPNKPVDNNDASMPSVNIGGFSYAAASISVNGAYASITIGSGGTWVYIAHSGRLSYPDTYRVEVGRISGGSIVESSVSASPSYTAFVRVIAWRIA